MALSLLVAFLFQGTWALAGTTGSLNGVVTDSAGAPVAGAAVKAISASQSATATTDAGGHFSFISLAPDTYTVSVDKKGYTPSSLAGVTVFADQSLTLSLKLAKSLKTIAVTTATAAGNLVKSGTTSDVYSVNPAAQAAQAGSAGGYNLNSAYSAIYNQPGVQGYAGNYGVGQVFYIRGSAYSQVGYEYDGVPVNRAFDNYNANSLSSLGQQELQVYTGGSPAGGSSATLGGYINQVIKTGTYPGTGTGELGIGTPNFYHSLKAEVGGATPNRLFSYYIGLSGYDQVYPFVNSQNGNNLNPDGSNQYGLTGAEISMGPQFFLNTGRGPWPECNPTTGLAPAGAPTPLGAGVGGACVSFLPIATLAPYTNSQMNMERDTVINLHFGIPHRKDGGRDDVQVLYDGFSVPQYLFDSINSECGLSCLNTNLAEYANTIAPLLGGSPTPTTGGVSQYPNLCASYNAGAIFTFNPITGGPVGCNTTGNPFTYADGAIFAPGTQFGQLASAATVQPYYFPFTPTTRAAFSTLPTNVNDEIINNGNIIKLQYQKNIGSNAYARLLGYTFYSDWLQSGATQAATVANTLGVIPDSIASADYELSTHTRGLQLEFADQINDKNLVALTGNYTTASVVRWNNFQGYQGNAIEASSLNENQPTNLATFNNGVATCYNSFNGQPTSCFANSNSTSDNSQGTYSSVTGIWNTGPTPLASTCNQPQYAFNPGTQTVAPIPGTSMAGTPACTAGAQFLVTAPGGYGLANRVQPRFSSVALTDTWQPNDKLNFNLGVRYENYQYILENTNTPSNQFWFSSAANTYCYWSNTGLPVLSAVTPSSPVASPISAYNATAGQNANTCYGTYTNPGSYGTGLTPMTGPEGTALHPNGQGGNLLFSPISAPSVDKVLFSPRFGMTYTVNPDTVLRFSYGRYSQPTETAFEQYTGPSGAFVSNFLYSHFWALGFHNPGHDNPVQVSNNFDFSYEHHFKGTDWTLKLSPYYRYTMNQLISVALGGNFASGINAATQKSSGLELAIAKGDPSRDGLSGSLSYTYSKAIQKYSPVGGLNAIQNINAYIDAFNTLTSAGGGAPCYNPAVLTSQGFASPVTSAASCTQAAAGAAGYIVNPYYNYPLQSDLAVNGWYPAYVNNPPTSIGSSVTTQTSPNQFAGFLSWKKKKLQIILNGLLQQGNTYGSPLDIQGYDPRTCGANQAAVPGTNTPGNADYTTCGSTLTPGGSLAVPSPLTQQFAGVGTFREPWQLNIGAQINYTLTPHVTAQVVLANLLNRCFGGQMQPGSAYAPNAIDCGWNTNGSYLSDYYYGNSPTQAANGTAGYPAIFNLPYAPTENGLPFQAYFNLQFRL